MRFILSLLMIVASSAAFAAGTTYFSAFPELPLAPHLSEDPISAVRFDKPEGRIIALQAAGPAQAVDIQKFYADTLPALGWAPAGDNRYSRAKETLVLDIQPLDKPFGRTGNRVNILLKPQEK